MKLVFEITANRRLIFAAYAVKQLRAHRQLAQDMPEAGGVLLGRHLLDSEDLVVDEVTVPQTSDRRGRFSFFRSKRHHELALARWQATQGRSAYLGLWHTHPEADPTPSCVDRRDWTKAVAKGQFDGDWLFFPVVGIDHIRVWAKTRNGPILELHKVR